MLPSPIERFILQWGEFGGQWGVNKSVSQIHAYLYLSDFPLTADQICEELGMARSNVSNSLKELLTWKLIRKVPLKGERKDHYEAETDVWEIATCIAAIRKSREIDPALATLRSVSGEAAMDQGVTDTQRRKLQNMLEFTEAVDRWYTQMLSLPRVKRLKILTLGAKIASYLPVGK